MYKYIEMTGKRFGKMTVLSRSDRVRGKERAIFWNCVCDCGNHRVVSGTSLRSGQIVTCGCSRQDPERIINRVKKQVINRFDRAVNMFLHRYQQQAQKRGYSWEITREHFISLIQSNCYYCGEEPDKLIDVSTSLFGDSFMFNGIDRVINSVGYTQENTVACCSKCNYMKASHTKTDFLEHVKQIYQYQYNQLP